MLFQVYGENSMYQILGWVLVFTALVLTNEIQRRTKLGGYGFFIGVLGVLTVYFIAIYVAAAQGAEAPVPPVVLVLFLPASGAKKAGRFPLAILEWGPYFRLLKKSFHFFEKTC